MSDPARKLGEFRYADYTAWPENERWQLLDGVAHAMAPPTWGHQSVVFELGRQLGNALLGSHCQVRAGPVGVRLPRAQEADEDIRTVFEPDLLVVCDPAKIDRAGVRGAPDVVIEVLSPSTASFDLIGKRLAYERAGVRELWLFDLANGVVSIYRQQAPGTFAPPEWVATQGRVALTALPGVELDLDFVEALRDVG
ncbi:MAG: Uma2 family endonuclease [Rhodanobacteraceae bacterium]|nr:Uma2 family endonuclease [Rhodanobacteraceae bacterium]